MSSFYGNSIGIMIIIIMLIFIGIWIWAWQGRHRATFDRLSEIPMEDPLETEDESQLEELNGSNSSAKPHRNTDIQTEHDNKGN